MGRDVSISYRWLLFHLCPYWRRALIQFKSISYLYAFLLWCKEWLGRKGFFRKESPSMTLVYIHSYLTPKPLWLGKGNIKAHYEKNIKLIMWHLGCVSLWTHKRTLGACASFKLISINRHWLKTQACLMSNNIKLSLKT